ncbi:MAG: hypothetical protein ACRC1G_17835 [Bradyrhizobium sp.]|nr:hypothetical protein [Bradyrhizobium sp.]
MSGTVVEDPPPSSTGGGGCACASLMIPGFNRMVLVIGTVDSISPSAIAHLDLPPKPGPVKGRVVKLTDALRKSLALRATRSIMKLTAIYNTLTGFQERISHKTERGQYLQKQYEHYFGEISRLTSDDLKLLNHLCSASLRLAPFAKTMLALADGGRVPVKEKSQKLSKAAIEAAQAVLLQYAEASEDPGFKELIDELVSEAGEYQGLTAQDALDKFRSAPAFRGARS